MARRCTRAPRGLSRAKCGWSRCRIRNSLKISSPRSRRPMSGLDETELARLDLQSQILGIDAALREAAGDEPQARLRRAREHVAQLLSFAEAPDRADARRDFRAE